MISKNSYAYNYYERVCTTYVNRQLKFIIYINVRIRGDFSGNCSSEINAKKAIYKMP